MDGDLTLMVDGEEAGFTLEPNPIPPNSAGKLILNKKEEIPYEKGREIRIIGGAMAMSRTATQKFGNLRILALGDWYSLCRVRDYWKTEVTNDDLASAIPDDYMDYDIIHLRGDGNAGNSPIDEAKLENFLSAGKGIYVVSAACDPGHFGCNDDNWFPLGGYSGSAGLPIPWQMEPESRWLGRNAGYLPAVSALSDERDSRRG